jgi:hypothetical protein
MSVQVSGVHHTTRIVIIHVEYILTTGVSLKGAFIGMLLLLYENVKSESA